MISPNLFSVLTLVALTLMPVQSVASTAGIETLLEQYSEARAQENHLRQMLYSSRIKKLVFSSEDHHSRYFELLHEIDQYAKSEPEAAYELAKSLQLHWEARYAARVQGADALRQRAGGEIGAMAGMLGLGLALMKPNLLPRYFRLVRHLLPVVGTLGGAGAVSAAQSLGQSFRGWNSDIPPSPAHVMKLDLPQTDLELDDEALVAELVSMSASIGVSSLILSEASAIHGILKALRLARVANQSASVFKVHPVVLIASLVAGVVVEEGAHAAIRGHLSKQLKQDVLSSAKACRQAIRENDNRAILETSDALAMAVARLSRFQDRKFDEAIKDYAQDQAEIAAVVSDMGEDHLPEGYLEAVQKIANRNFEEELQDIKEEQPLSLASRHYLVRDAISSQGPQAVPAMMQGDLEVTREELSRFMQWVSDREHRTGKAVTGSARTQLMLSYFAHQNLTSRTYWANDLARGKIAQDPVLNLLWAQSLIESSKREFVSDALDLIAGELNRARLVRRGGLQ